MKFTPLNEYDYGTLTALWEYAALWELNPDRLGPIAHACGCNSDEQFAATILRSKQLASLGERIQDGLRVFANENLLRKDRKRARIKRRTK